MSVTRRRWLEGVAGAAAGVMAARGTDAASGQVAGAAVPGPGGCPLPPSVARIADVAIDDEVEPALVFVAAIP